MDHKDIQNKTKDQVQSKSINSNNLLKNIKSEYFIWKFFDYIHKRISLGAIRYNKNLQKNN